MNTKTYQTPEQVIENLELQLEKNENRARVLENRIVHAPARDFDAEAELNSLIAARANISARIDAAWMSEEAS